MTALVEDLSLFFDEFSVPATLVSGVSIDVIFDRAFIESMGGQIDSTSPVCVARDAHITLHTIGFGTVLSIAAVPYTVRAMHPDGTGLTTLMLEAS